MGHNRRRWHLVAMAIGWLATRTLMIYELGYFRHGIPVKYQDVEVYQSWANRIVETHQLPGEAAWQYPPGAAVVFLLPRLIPSHYGAAFVGLVLIADAIAALVLVSLSRRGGSAQGVWLWLLAIPVLGTLPLLRFDTIPTCIAVVALALVSARSRNFRSGLLVGLGIAVKIWPVLVLLAVRTRRGARSAVLAAAATVAAFLVVSWLVLGDALGFLGNHRGRGLELEAVAATPWYLRQALTGHAVDWAGRNGSVEIVSAKADLIARVLLVAMFGLAIALVIWWLRWTRRPTRSGPDVGRDAVFTAALLFVVLSEVLSPQYVIWLVGLGAVAVASPSCRVRRPVWITAVGVVLTAALVVHWGDLVHNGTVGAYLLSMRNMVLLVAALDAALTMWRALREARVETPAADVGSPVGVPSLG